MSDTILTALAVTDTEGGVLVFLPGEGEIRRTLAALLGDRVPRDVTPSVRCSARSTFADQRAAICASQRESRKLVLATAIAETSLTIEDIRVVVDAGRARRARFDPSSGMTRLVTERVTRAEATQRAGRAGRVAPGVAYRLWTRGEEGALAPFPPAEIEAADLAPLALELAAWGADPGDLPFLTPPPDGAYAEARDLLGLLGALDGAGRITPHGRRLAGHPLHPRLAHMLAVAGPGAAPLAALLADRDPLGRGAPVDLTLRLSAITDPRAYAGRHPHPANRGTVERIRAEAKRLARQARGGAEAGLSAAEMAALAYPDRIGLRRNGEHPALRAVGRQGRGDARGRPDGGRAAHRGHRP